jgi:uncharacterized membrane protein YgcG
MMFNLRTKRSMRSEKIISVRLIRWLLAIIIILLITSGLWNSVFAQTSSSENDEFIPVALGSDKSADYSQDLQSYTFRTISLAIVTDILRDENIPSAGQYNQRVDVFFDALTVPVPSANPLPSSPSETINLISFIIDDQGIEKQVAPTSDHSEDEGFTDRSWPTMPLILEDIQNPATNPDEEFSDRPWPTDPLVLTDLPTPTSSTTDPVIVETPAQSDPDGGGSGGGDGGGNSGGGDVGGDPGGGDGGGGGKDKNDGKDDNPNDGDAGKGNDDKEDKEKKEKKDKDK